MKNIFLILISIVLIFAGVFVFTSKEKSAYQNKLYPLEIGSTKITVELAQSQGERGQGLGDRKSLSPDQGMLFVFDKPDIYPFWMRDMQFPLDIIWLDENYQVVDMVTDLKPESYPQSFAPAKKALYVLEVNAGVAEKNNIKIGATAKLPTTIKK